MRKPVLSLCLLFAAEALTPAWAQDWQTYREPQGAFSAAFPGTPDVSGQTYKLADGTALPAKLYDARDGKSEFRILVVDFSGAKLQGDAAVNQVIARLAESGKIDVDVNARINRNWGRELSVSNKDGGRTVLAVFFVGGHLFQLEGVIHPGGDMTSPAPVRFQQSLDFGNYGSGGFGRRGFGRFGFGR